MSDGLRQRLRRWLGAPGAGENQLDMATDMDRSTVQPASAPASETPDGALPDISGLEKQIAKLGREQFKLNASLEAQQQQVQMALRQLREQDAHRVQEQSDLLANHRADLAEARLQVVQRLLPVLDGLDEAIGAGERLLARTLAEPASQVPGAVDTQSLDHPVRWAVTLAMPIAWLESHLGVRNRRAAPANPPINAQPSPSTRDADEWRTAFVGWMRGLTLVRDRFLETLAAEGIYPMRAIGQLFDPRWHVVLDTVPASPNAPSGTVVAEVRRGYRAGERVLRYAEVIVSQGPRPQQASSDDQ